MTGLTLELGAARRDFSRLDRYVGMATLCPMDVTLQPPQIAMVGMPPHGPNRYRPGCKSSMIQEIHSTT